MDLAKLYRSSLWASAKLRVLEVAGLGWADAKVLHDDAMGGTQAFFYAWDLPTGWSRMWSVQVEDGLHQGWQDVRRTPAEWPEIRSALGDALGAAAGGTPQAYLPEHTWEESMGILMAAYAATTKTLEAAQDLKNGGHFIVLNYRPNKQSDKGMLRPMALRGDASQPLSADYFRDTVAQVVEHDRKAHPDWFA